MGAYFASWKKSDSGIYQGTISYRDRAPKGSVVRLRPAAVRNEEAHPNGMTPADRLRLYSDLYAEANDSETYNAEDLGHEFLTQKLKTRPLRDLPKEEIPGTSGEQGPLGMPDWYINMFFSSGNPDSCIIPLGMHQLVNVDCRNVRDSYDYDENRVRGSQSYRSLVRIIQNTLWAQCPDSISGSLGQDVVDVVAFGKMLDKLLTLRSRGVSLYRQYLNFSAKKKRQIDRLFARWRRHPSKSLKDLTQGSSQAYLSWMFQYLPWWEDLQTLFGDATSAYVRTVGRTRERKIVGLGKVVDMVEHDAQLPAYRMLIRGDRYPYGIMPFTMTDKAGDVATKATASVVSVWTKSFEHGSVEPLIQLNKQLGLVYPSLVWDLIPWTWLTDWFVNVGDFIDRTWMKSYGEWNCSYAYVTYKVTATWHGMTYLETCRTHIHPSTAIEANGLSGFSNPQWQILAALGLSRRK